MKRRAVLAMGAVAGSLSLAACGGGDDESANKTFEEKGFGITFEYPPELKRATSFDLGRQLGGGAAKTAGVGLNYRNAILVQRTNLTKVVTSDDLTAVRRELEQ